MAADGIVGQGRHFLGRGKDISVRQKACLDQCLKSVADTEDETFSLVEKFHYTIGDLVFADDVRNELARAVGVRHRQKNRPEERRVCVLNQWPSGALRAIARGLQGCGLKGRRCERRRQRGGMRVPCHIRSSFPGNTGRTTSGFAPAGRVVGPLRATGARLALIALASLPAPGPFAH